MDLLFDDVPRLGRVMQVDDRAEALVAGWKAEPAAIEMQTADLKGLRVFLLDSPADAPSTAGKFAIPDAMIAAASGTNVTRDLDTSWGRTSWGRLQRPIRSLWCCSIIRQETARPTPSCSCKSTR